MGGGSHRIYLKSEFCSRSQYLGGRITFEKDTIRTSISGRHQALGRLGPGALNSDRPGTQHRRQHLVERRYLAGGGVAPG